MKLNEGIIGGTYKVIGVAVEEKITRRLEYLCTNILYSITVIEYFCKS